MRKFYIEFGCRDETRSERIDREFKEGCKKARKQAFINDYWMLIVLLLLLGIIASCFGIIYGIKWLVGLI